MAGGPWEDYAPAKTAETKPWEDYQAAKPAAAPVARAAADPVTAAGMESGVVKPSMFQDLTKRYPAVKDFLFANAMQAAGLKSATDIYDETAAAVADLASKALGVPKSTLDQNISPVPGLVSGANELVRTIPELIDFAMTPGGALAMAGPKIPKVGHLVKPAVGAAFTVDMGQQVPAAVEAAVAEPTPANVVRAGKTAAFAAAPLIHSRGEARQARPFENVRVAPDTPAEAEASRAALATNEELHQARTDPAKATAVVKQEIARRQAAGQWDAQLERTPSPAEARARKKAAAVTVPVEGDEHPALTYQRDNVAADLASKPYAELSAEERGVADDLVRQGYGMREAGEPARAVDGRAVPVPVVPGEDRGGVPGRDAQSAVPEVRAGDGDPAGAAEAKPVAARQPSGPVVYGREAAVRVPGERTRYRSVYAVREAEDVHASHNAQNFERNPAYQYENDRNYSDPQNAERIVRQAAEFDPGFLINDNPDATNGPPIIDANGNVLGGNSRTMTMARVREQRPEAMAAYRSQLEKQAKAFGLDPEMVRRMKNPVLVRQVAETNFDAQRAITDFNKVGTAELKVAERAVADSRRIGQDTLDLIQRRIEEQGPDGTLAKALDAGDNRELINRLEADGIITLGEKPKLLNADGSLTADGKGRVSRLLIGRLFEDARQLEDAAPQLKQKLERVVAPLARVAGREGWDITQDVKDAVRLVEESRTREVTIDDLVRQGGLFGDAGWSENAIALAQVLKNDKPTELAKRFRQYATEAEMADSGQGMMFGDPPNQVDSFLEAFVGQPGKVQRVRLDAVKIPRLPKETREAEYSEGLPTIDHASRSVSAPIELDPQHAKYADAYALNLNAMEFIGRATGAPADLVGQRFAGLHIQPGDVALLLKNVKILLRGQSLNQLPEGVRSLLESVRRTAGTGKSFIAIAEHASREKYHEAALTEEIGHAIQATVGAGETSHLGAQAASFTAHPLFEKAARTLGERYENEHPEKMAVEVGVRLMRRTGYHELGLSAQEARQIAALYIRSLRREYGSKPPKAIAEEVFRALRERDKPGQHDPGADSLRSKGRSGTTGRSGPDLSGYIPPGNRRLLKPGQDVSGQRKVSAERRRTQRGSVTIGPVEPKAETAAASPPPGEAAKTAAAVADDGSIPVSPSYDKTRGKILDKANISDQAKEALSAAMDKWEEANPERRRITHAELAEEAKSLDPTLLADMDRKAAQELVIKNPALYHAARELVVTLADQAAKLEEQIRTAPRDTDTLELERKHDIAERDMRQLLGITTAVRSQHGRNLAMHRKMVDLRGFDPTYWDGRAKKALGLPADASLPVDVQRELTAITAEGRAAEAEAVEKVKQERQRRKPKPAETETPLPEAEHKRARGETRKELNRLEMVERKRKEIIARLKAQLLDPKQGNDPVMPEEYAAFERDPEIVQLRGALAVKRAMEQMERDRKPEFADRAAAVEAAKQKLVQRLEAVLRGKKSTVNPVSPEERLAFETDSKVQELRQKIEAKRQREHVPVSSERRVAKGVERKLAAIDAQMNPQPGAAPGEWALTPEERQKVDADPRVQAAKRELARKMAKLEKTTWLEAISSIRRAGLLTSPRTHARNLAGNTTMQALEEISRVPASMLDIAMQLFRDGRTVEGMSGRAVARATYAAATKGLAEARQVMRQGATDEQLAQFDMPKEMNLGPGRVSRVLELYTNGVFRSMSAADRVFKRYAMQRSLEEQMSLAKVDTPTEAMIAQAIADADFATFNNPNKLAGMYSRAKAGASPGVRFAMDMVMPFVRTPANVLARVLDYSGGGLVKAAAAGVKAAVNQAMTAEQRRYIAQNFGRGVTGPALIYMGYQLAAAGLATGSYQDDAGKRNTDEAAGRLAGAVKIGGTWQMVSPLSPGGALITIGATLQREATGPLRDEARRPGRLAMVAARTVLDHPFLQGAKEVTEAISNPAQKGERVVASMAGSFVPTFVSDVASLADTRRRDSRSDGDTLDAAAAAIAARTPGLRNRLPERKDVLGRPQPQSASAVINPGIGSPAKEDSDPIIRELVRNRVAISEPQRAAGETVDEFRLRREILGREIERQLGREIQSAAYRALKTEEERRGALDKAEGRARRLVGAKLGKRYAAAKPGERLKMLQGMR